MDNESATSIAEVEESRGQLEEEPEEEEVDPRTLLTNEQVQYYKDIFATFDTQKKERIPAKTIGFVLRFMGLNPTKAEIKREIEEADPQNKGLIDFQSFLLPIARRVETEPETHEDIIAAFQSLDEDELGYLTTDQLQEYLTTLGEDLEDFEIEIFLKMAETKGTGKVYYQEFVEKMMGIVRKVPKESKKDKKKGGKKKK